MGSHGQRLPTDLKLPRAPPLYHLSPLEAHQQRQVAELEEWWIDKEKNLGPFQAGSIEVTQLEKLLLEQAPLAEEKAIISEALGEAKGHTIPWARGPPQPSLFLSHRTPELFSPEEAAAIDQDVAEGMANGTYQEVPPNEVACCLARRPVQQREKYRIIDDARPLNRQMDERRCSVLYEDLSWGRTIAAPFMTKIDLKKGYRQIRLAPEAKPYFCFIWRERLYRFDVMAFGDASAPSGFTKFMKGFSLRWRRRGIVCIVYLDDILISASTFDEWFSSVKTVLSDLAACRVRIGLDKLMLGPFDCIEFLGVFIDHRSSSLFISDERITRAVETCISLRSNHLVSVKEVQSFLGHLSFFSTALMGLSLFRRSLDLWVSTHTDEEAAPLSHSAMAEIEFLATALPTWAKKSFGTLPFAPAMLVSDASESAWGGLLVQGGTILVAGCDQLPPEMLGASSTTRELFGLLSFLKLCIELSGDKLTHCRLQCQIDNQAAGILVSGAKAKALDALPLMRELLTIQLERDLQLVVDWRERSDHLISLVDALSKMETPLNPRKFQQILHSELQHQGPPRNTDQSSTAEWSLDKPLFHSVCEWAWGSGELPEVDLFATAENRQVPSFCSRYFSPESLGNAFSLAWDNRRLYAFPPWSQLPQVLNKLKDSTNVTLLLVTKLDRASPAWPLIQQHKQRSLSAQTEDHTDTLPLTSTSCCSLPVFLCTLSWVCVSACVCVCGSAVSVCVRLCAKPHETKNSKK